MGSISGTHNLHRLIYASRAEAAPIALDGQVDDIIRTSVRNNREVGVTGLLLVHAGWFVQALEGPAEAVMTTYGRIVRDPRHAEPLVISAGPTERREFADWSMCARRLTPADDAILSTLARKDRFEPAALSGPQALRLLTAVRGIQERTQLGVSALLGSESRIA